ncbi:Spy/CpxP family protein refolding chaperone [Janthinobacterium sp.]|uniref:Spy/CpxP family protein refolding chaperone n=1 Tax=Janthinobacterium sp. TaxID=1871054 RepID=UPI00293D40EC|nr:Spy/CpxP family protein refolding chaperone [Janthinobacterium sp.]
MKHTQHFLPRFLLCATLALSGAAMAADEMPPPPGAAPRHAEGPPPFGRHGHGGAPFLRGLELSEAQQDKIFAIEHAQEPLLREQHKIVAKAHEALHALTLAASFDEARGAALAQTAAQAMARIALLRARGEQQILALLTPAQRQQMEQHEQDGARRPARPR